MADDEHREPISETLHELAEGLRAAGNYLYALRRGGDKNGTAPVEMDVVNRALVQWARAQHAMRELRACLNNPERG
jgi:hypothetical protein